MTQPSSRYKSILLLRNLLLGLCSGSIGGIKMVFIALLTLGYFAGVLTTLFIFPPKTNELREQEHNALAPIVKMEEEKEVQTIPNSIRVIAEAQT